MTHKIISAFLPPRAGGDLFMPSFGIDSPASTVAVAGTSEATAQAATAAAWAEAVKVLGDVWKNEETRFSNLNTRAVALLSASSLITTVLGFFSKNVLDTSAARLSAGQERTAQWGTYIALVLFGLTALTLVLGVLLPGKRLDFGKNALVGKPPYKVENDYKFNATAGTATTAAAIDAAACGEYGGMYVALANRSRRKAYWIQVAYLLFALAIIASVVATIIIVHSVPPAAAT